MGQPLSFIEKAGYSAGDAAANLVFMTMVLFQLNFYTDVFGLSAGAAAAILLWPRLWDAVFDPIVGVLADRTETRWGKFRPWVLWTSVPWAIVMVLAYTTPDKSWGWSTGMLVAYAGITNTLLMTLYSMNNMPYSALGGVMTSDLDERTKLNSYRFVSVNVAQFVVGGFTLPLVAKFAQGHDRQHGWQVTMTIWAAACLVLFLVTFLTTRERVKPVAQVRSSPKQDFADLLKNGPWIALFAYTLFHFAMLALRGGAHYNYYHHYADKAAMFDFVETLGLTTANPTVSDSLADTLGYIVHGTRDSIANSNVADVFNSIVNMIGFGTTIVVIMLSTGLAARCRPWNRLLFDPRLYVCLSRAMLQVETHCLRFVLLSQDFHIPSPITQIYKVSIFLYSNFSIMFATSAFVSPSVPSTKNRLECPPAKSSN